MYRVEGMVAKSKMAIGVSDRNYNLKTLVRNASAGLLIAGSILTVQDNARAQYTNTFMPFEGLCYSGYRTNENPNWAGSYPTMAEMNYDFTNVIKFMAPEIRTYGLSGSLSNIPSLCYSNNIGCYPCAYVEIDISGTNYFISQDSTNEINMLIAIGNKGYPTTKGLIVGSEAFINTSDPNVVATLNQWISYVRKNLTKSVPITTALTWDNVIDWPQLATNEDFLSAHIDPWWNNIAPSNTVNFVLSAYQAVTNAYPGKRVVIMETGAPSNGNYSNPTEPNSVASMANQTQFLIGLNAMLRTNRIECLLFEPFDELWPDAGNTNDIQDNWGIEYPNRTKKSSLVSYLSSDFQLSMGSVSKINTVRLEVNTYESDPYSIYWSTNLANGWNANPLTNFNGTLGTNQTTLTITNFGFQTIFYKAGQNF
jgi:exo-beta-1,3-glucanase (GH17 family)